MTDNYNYDCLIIGYNDIPFGDLVGLLEAIGTEHADYRDLDLNFIHYNGTPYRATDILTKFYLEGKNRNDSGGAINSLCNREAFYNYDVMWICVMYLVTYLNRRGFNVDYVNLFDLQKDELRDKLQNNSYRTVVVTTSIYNFEQPIMDVISFVRRYQPETSVIVGGPFVSKRAERLEKTDLQTLFKYLGADYYVCTREGEQTLVSLLTALKENNDLSGILNLAFRKDKEFEINPFELELNPLEENMIDYSLFPPDQVGPLVNLRFSKGCPYHCAFCGYPLRTKQYHAAGIDCIKKELDTLRDLGTVTHLHLIDDTFNVPKKRFKQFLELMIQEKYGFKWHCYFRCDNMDEEIVPLMKDAGCIGVFLGIESTDETVLKNMNKRTRIEDYRKTIPLFKAHGISTFISIFIGFPGETVETFRTTMDFLREMEPDFYRPQLWYCDTLTPIWEERERFGLTGNNFSWTHDTMDSKTACYLLEESMLSLDMPVWAPDPGYNYVAVYLMHQRGMDFEKQKTFLSCFNAIVKEKLLFPGKKEPSPALIESLKQACLFDEKPEPELESVEALSSDRFNAARIYWVKQFKQPKSRSYFKPHRESGLQVSPVTGVSFQLLEQLKQVLGANESEILLAAYGTMLLRLRGDEDHVIVTSPDNGAPFPLSLHSSWSMSFRDFVAYTRKQSEEAIDHRNFAFYILTHPLRKLEYPEWAVSFDTAFLFGNTKMEHFLAERMAWFPSVRDSIGLALEVVLNEGEGVDICFGYSPQLHPSHVVDRYHRYIQAILETAASNPEISLTDIQLEPQTKKTKPAASSLADKAFNF